MLATLLLCALAAVAVLYVRATRPLYWVGDEPLVAQATRAAAREFGTTEQEIRRMTFPILMNTSELTCIELRPKRSDLVGYQACYARRGGKLVEERVQGAPFGGRKFFPALW
ncbi:MAG: hypothetical protein E6G94_13985 [Alphaproteobacteria bacterium]|nr:MAG: hypothetical protein E6G94_13985 [Alphaproteobacteria bacterium]